MYSNSSIQVPLMRAHKAPLEVTCDLNFRYYQASDIYKIKYFDLTNTVATIVLETYHTKVGAHLYWIQRQIAGSSPVNSRRH